MASVLFKKVTKIYPGGKKVLSDFDLSIEDGSFTVLVGPSGCGKTTALRIIAGLEGISSGQVFVADRDVTHVDPGDRGIAMVFQNYAIYPHMTVRKNIEFGLKNYGMKKDEINRRINDVVGIVGLEEYINSKPGSLSGGQRQRVALARAISKQPDVFLMDEPLSNLDAKLRNQMRAELIDLHRKLGTTFVYVTHDQVEAMTMGDHIIVMSDGKIMQQGTPKAIFHDPDNLFVASFIGDPSMNLIEYQDYVIGFRPRNCSLEMSEGARICLLGTVHLGELLGGEVVYTLQTKEGYLRVCSQKEYETGKAVTVRVPEESLFIFSKPEDGGARVRDKKLTEEIISAFAKHLAEVG